jgi:hypothetical protein
MRATTTTTDDRINPTVKFLLLKKRFILKMRNWGSRVTPQKNLIIIRFLRDIFLGFRIQVAGFRKKKRSGYNRNTDSP